MINELENKIEELLLEWELRRSAVDPISAEDLCHEQPELLPELQRRVESLRATEWMFAAQADTRPDEAVSIGRQLGEYDLVEYLGAGGMGTVYKARHRRLDKLVALKVLAAGRLWDRTSAARFEREMRAIGKLEHPHIVSAYDAGEVDGTKYLAMQLVEGTDVGRLLKQHGPLGVADACEIARQAALGLQYAHDHGLIHRDVKPSNLILGTDGVLKVLDLGLARIDGPPPSPLSGVTVGDRPAADEFVSSGQVMGTLDYMAPEQCDDSHAVDQRADLYALGATLYKLLCGKAPLEQEQADTTLKKLRALAQGDIPSLRTRGQFPEALLKLVDQMLARDPADRPSSAREIARQLEPFAKSSNLRAVTRRLTTADSSLQDTDPLHTATITEPRLDSHATKRLPAPWTPSRIAQTAIALSLIGLLVVAAVVITIKTDRGTLVVKAADGVTVELLEKSGVQLTHRATGRAYQVTIGAQPQPSGEYTLEVSEPASGLKFSTRRFSIERGQTQDLEVTLESLPKADPTNPPADSSMTSRVPELSPRFHHGHQLAKAFQILYTPDGQSLLVTGDTESILVLDAATGAEQRRLSGHQNHSRVVQILADGKTVVSGDEAGYILLHDLETGQLAREVRQGGANARSLSVAPDEKSIVVATLGGVERVDLKTGNTELLYRTNSYQCGFYRDGTAIWAKVFKSGLARFDLNTKQADWIVRQPPNTDSQLVLHPETNTAAFITTDGRVEMLDLDTSKVVRGFQVEVGQLISGAFSRSGKLLTITSQAGSTSVYDVATGTALLRLAFLKPIRVTSLHFSPDDKSLAALHETGGVTVWDLPANLPPPSNP